MSTYGPKDRERPPHDVPPSFPNAMPTEEIGGGSSELETAGIQHFELDSSKPLFCASPVVKEEIP
jgi:hypothetical protein